jgi:hypothetical protein
MNSTIRRSMTTVALASIPTMLAVPAQAGEGDFSYKIVADDYSYGEASFSIEGRERLMVDGAEQLTWWYPDHNVEISNRAIRRAPRVVVDYRECARQSRSIAKQADGANIVVAMPGSVICNTGKNGNITGGFKWTVDVPAVLKWNKKLGLYEHLFNLVKPANVGTDDEVMGHIKIGGVKYAIVKKCRNRLGGQVDKMYDKVVQVRYSEDIKESGKAVAEAMVTLDATFSVTCPNGANFNVKVTTKALGLSESYIEFTERTSVSILNAKKAELEREYKIDGGAKALAKAETAIEVSGTCGDNPPPSYESPSVHVTPVACVNPGQTRDVTVTAFNPNDKADSARLTFRGQTVGTKSVAANSEVSFVLQDVPAGSYTGSVLLETANKSKSFTVTVEDCPPPADNPPTMVCTVPEHIYVGDDAMWADFDITDPDGDAVSFNEPVLTGPIEKVTTDLTNVTGGKRLSVKFRATAIPEGTSQTAMIKVTGQAGGKSVSCSGSVIVENADTGW